MNCWLVLLFYCLYDFGLNSSCYRTRCKHKWRRLITGNPRSSEWRFALLKNFLMLVCDNIFFFLSCFFCFSAFLYQSTTRTFSSHVSFPCFLSSLAPRSLSTLSFPAAPLTFALLLSPSLFLSFLCLYCSPLLPPAPLKCHSRPTSTAAAAAKAAGLS